MPRFHELRRGLGLACTVAVAVFAPTASQAQGSIGSQGFGYPIGGLSAGALGAAGAGAESDPNSAVNPAAITQNARYTVMVQFQPEFRRTSLPTQDINTTVMRFPTFQATGTYRRFTGSVGVSTLLDRSWVNRYSDSLQIGGEWVPSEIQTSSAGALSDVRAALGYVINKHVQVGIGLHGFAGENRTTFDRLFPDTSGVGGLSQSAAFGFAGTAISAGVVTIPRDGLVLAASVRSGGALTLEENGNEAGRGGVPTRFGVGVNWLAIPGAAISARVDRTLWSEMEGLGTSAVSIFDATELAIGTDILGPKIGGTNSLVRAGLRDRTLPFGVNGNQIRERAMTFGLGLPIGRSRGQVDIAAQRAMRTGAGFEERGWFVSIGLGIRP
jgi:hypothetical protein